MCQEEPWRAIPVRPGSEAGAWRAFERIRGGEAPGYTLFVLADRLRSRGWQVPAYTLTGAVSDIPVQRVLVRLGVSRDMASLLIDDFRDAVAHFTRHPVSVPMTKEESGGFSHL